MNKNLYRTVVISEDAPHRLEEKINKKILEMAAENIVLHEVHYHTVFVPEIPCDVGRIPEHVEYSALLVFVDLPF